MKQIARYKKELPGKGKGNIGNTREGKNYTQRTLMKVNNQPSQSSYLLFPA